MKKINLKSKQIVAINLFLIFILMTVSVYAWFATQVNNTVDAYDIQVNADESLQLSFDNVTWSGTLNLADLKNANNESVLDTMKFVEVTSDGNTFRIPQLTQKTNYAIVNTSAAFSSATANQDYLEFTVNMRSKEKLNVYLSSDSKAAPSSTVFKGNGCGNPSSYATGDDSFSKDCIVGALRVGYKDNSGTDQIWITNPEFHLNNKVGSSTYTMDIDAGKTEYSDGPTSINEGVSDFFWNNPYKHYYYNGNTLTSKTVITELSDSVTQIPTDTKTHIAVLGGTPDSNGYYSDSVKFRVWIEGCDTEARRALVDGRFNLSLVFDSYGIQ